MNFVLRPIEVISLYMLSPFQNIAFSPKFENNPSIYFLLSSTSTIKIMFQGTREA